MRVRDALGREVADKRIPGATYAIFRQGRIAALGAVGSLDPTTGAPMPVDAVFSIASMTKAMVSVVILQLFEEGRLLLADPVGKFLPELAALSVQQIAADGSATVRPARSQPTIQDLLRHTSGLTYQDRGKTPAHKLYPGSSIVAAVKHDKAAFLAAMAKAPLLFDPGTAWEYGFSTDILGLVVEAIEGRPLGTVLSDRLWRPLGMSDTAFTLSAETGKRYARAFANDPLTGAVQSIHHATGAAMKWESGGGGAVSSARDYLRFSSALLGQGALGGTRILGRKTVELMTADHLGPAIDANRIADSMDPSCAGYGFGLGVAVRRQTGVAAMAGSAGDYYWSGVYGTYFWVDAKEDMTVVFMGAVPGLLRLRYRQLMRSLVYQAMA
jgi:CubicO group peptidase (beta-lactamase class C family)